MRPRLDEAVVAAGLAETRSRAEALIRAGRVLVDDVPVEKPGARVAPGAVLRLRGDDKRFASRGGDKLAGALEDLGVPVAGRLCLDVLQGIERHPFYVRLDRAIHDRLGASGVAQIFALGEAEALAATVAAAGFRDVAVEPASMVSLFPNPDGFLAGEIEVDTAAIPSMQALSAPERADLVAAIRDEMAGPLAEVIRDGQVAMPFHVLIVSATRSG